MLGRWRSPLGEECWGAMLTLSGLGAPHRTPTFISFLGAHCTNSHVGLATN